MLKKFFSFLLTALLIQLALVTPASAKSKEGDRQAQRAEKVKAGIAKLGVGEMARVQVKLQSGEKLEGYIREVSNENFVLMDTKTGTPVTVAYPQVKQVKGNNLSTGARIAIGVAIVAAILTIIVLAGKS
jgi:hypothetical protein